MSIIPNIMPTTPTINMRNTAPHMRFRIPITNANIPVIGSKLMFSHKKTTILNLYWLN